MGDFIGHVAPGIIFIFYGLWTAINMMKRYFSTRKINLPYVSSATFLLGRLPVEPVLKITAACLGMVFEYRVQTFQHMTMYFFYGLSGMIDFFVFFDFDIPEKLDYVALLLAFSTETVLFTFHLYMRTQLDILLHRLLILVLVGICVSIICEMKYENNFLVAMLRPYLFIIKGAWLCLVGNILYHPFSNPWDEESEMNLMKAAFAFAWLGGVVFVLLLVLFLTMSKIYSKKMSKVAMYSTFIAQSNRREQAYDGTDTDA